LEFLTEYGIFLAKSVTIVIVVLAIIVGATSVGKRNKKSEAGHIEVTHLNDDIEAMSEALKSVVCDKEFLKHEHKEKKKQDKALKKERSQQAKTGEHKKRVYVLDFEGDMKASGVDSLREEITTILTLAEPLDEVVIRLTSGGGMVHAYGLAASQIQRISNAKIPLTVCIDKVAASGGYMMACLADKIISAPFAIVGSIGVIAQLPNFHRILKKHDVDFEMFTAGEYKRTVTMFAENTKKGREKFMEELEDTHELFKLFVSEHRPSVDIKAVATGEIWFGKRALERNLVDQLGTSDEYITLACKEADVYQVAFEHKKTLQERLVSSIHTGLDRLILTWWDRIQTMRFYS
jgi:serine protease SohB